VNIGSGVTTISQNAFSGTGLTSVIIPNSVTFIGQSAFQASGMRRITLTDGANVLHLWGHHFSHALSSTIDTLHLGRNLTFSHSTDFSPFGTSIKHLTIGDSVTNIPDNAFRGSADLTTVTIPDSVRTIGNNAFRGTGITSINIPNGATSIGVSAFQDCKDLTSITIPNSVISIGNSAFQGSGLTSVILSNSITSIGASVFQNCPNLTSVTIPNSVTSIGNSAFQNSGLTGDLILPARLTSIGNSAFEDCSGLTGSLILPRSVTSIGNRAFANCTGLTSLNIPNNSITIGDFAFLNNTSLGSVISPNPTPPTVQPNTFLTLNPAICLYVPEAAIDAYKVAIGWNLFSCVEALAVHTVTFNLQGGTGVEAQNVKHGDRAIVPTPPIRGGAIFKGWSIDANGTIEWDFVVNIVTSDTTLFAKWDVILEGEGTSENPLKIATAEQLATVAELVNVGYPGFRDKHYILVANIDLSDYDTTFNDGRGWIPIGTSANPFRGHFDGDGYMISNLFISNGGVDNLGLFGVIDSGSVQNLAVVDVDIIGRSAIGGIVGALRNQNSYIHACYTTGIVRSTMQGHPHVGGIVGENYGRVENNYSASIVEAHLGGGIVGVSFENSSITNSYSIGEIRLRQAQARNTFLGGVVGSIQSKITNCVALNPSIIGWNNALRVGGGRVAGATHDTPTLFLSNNYAFSGMEHRWSREELPPETWEDTTHNGRDGAGMTAQQALTASFWTTASNWQGGSGWNTDVWIIENGRLPRLRVMRGEQPGVPQHITDHATSIVDIFTTNMNVYPNPFTDILHIAEAEGYTLRVMTQTGVVVHTQRITNSVETVNLQRLPTGVYILHLENNGQIKTAKIIKQ
jgi:hypothetical protein